MLKTESSVLESFRLYEVSGSVTGLQSSNLSELSCGSDEPSLVCVIFCCPSEVGGGPLTQLLI